MSADLRPQRGSRLLSALVLVALLACAGLGWLVWHKGIPVSAAGMASKMACSGVFVAGRPAQEVLDNDIHPASMLLRLVDVQINEREGIVKASMPGSVDRFAVHRGGRGCVLLEPGDLPAPDSLTGYQHTVPVSEQSANLERAAIRPIGLATKSNGWSGSDDESSATWPIGSLPIQPSQWQSGIDGDALERIVQNAFTGPPASSFRATRLPVDGPNTRALLVVHKGKLLIERYGPGFDHQTPQLGWSMAKTILSVLVWQQMQERGIALDTPVVDLVRRVPQPKWAGEWLRDQRSGITMEHLLTMRDGLAHEEGFSVFSDVPRMLFVERDIGRYAGTAPIAHPPGSHWRYASAVSNLTSRVLRAQFSTDREYWEYPHKALFQPIRADSALIESDAQGTLVASSFMWATAQDWARIGLVLLNDGHWQGQQVFEPGWWDWASQQRPDSPYGAHVWLTHQDHQLKCDNGQNLPANGMVLKGHWGQVIGLFPEQEVVVVRLGWTLDPSQLNACQFLHEILAAVDTPQ